MKKILKITLIFTLIYLYSCDEFLDVEPIASTTENWFTDEEEYNEALIGAYDLLQATYLNVLVGVIASDDYAAGGDSNNEDQPTLQHVNRMNHDPSDENQLREIWQLMYAGMNRANLILENKDKSDFEGKDEILAQAYFLRAYYSFELAKFYGGLPLKIEERNGVNRIVDKRILLGEEFDVERVGGISETYSLIEEDLKEAIPNLPINQDADYKATKGSAQALLGKVYLYHENFEDAATVLDEVISSGKFSLVQDDDYTNLFEVVRENGSESVFEIQYSGKQPGSWNCINCSQGTYFVKFCGPRSPYDNDVYEAGWGFCLPSEELYDLFDADDKRVDVTFYDLRGQEDSYGQGRDDTGLFNLKYMPRKGDEREGADPVNYPNNYRAIRYADVLLMAAEAEVQSSGTNAETYLNEVRARAYGDNSHDYSAGEGDLLEAIYTERRKELAGEGHRFFDLVRTGKAAASIEDFTVNKNEIFPIPLIELQLADAVERWGQNPGY